MLKVTHAEVTRSGGFLGALTSASTEYVHSVVKPRIKWESKDSPDRFIIHKAPHLDDYLAELLFRSALPSSERRREFLESALYAEDDSSAKLYWPSSAVFGIGRDKPCGSHAMHIFDEHLPHGGRTSDSCGAMVVHECYDSLPASVQRIVDEVSVIDSTGYAHDQHLNNLLKTSHHIMYDFGRNSRGRRMSGALSPAWKRAVVNAIIASMVYCMENNIDMTSPAVAGDCVRRLVDRFDESYPGKDRQYYKESLKRLRDLSGNVKMVLSKARITINGTEELQLLVVPLMCAAACQAWGEEIGYFLMVHFWESEILKNIHFARVGALVDECFGYRPPKAVRTHDLSIAASIVPEKRFLGKERLQTGEERPRSQPSNLWIISCRHGSSVIQPNKAMANVIADRNFGIGLVLTENTAEQTKALFKGKHLPLDYWNRIVERIQFVEEGLWYRPSATAAFLVNGNQAHRYVDMSSMTAGDLAKVCRSV